MILNLNNAFFIIYFYRNDYFKECRFVQMLRYFSFWGYLLSPQNKNINLEYIIEHENVKNLQIFLS